MPAETVTFPCRDVTLTADLYRPEGNGPRPAVVFSHGAFEFRENFREFGRFLAGRGIAALIPDMPGHGDSGGERYHIDIDRWVDAIGSAIDFLENGEGIPAGAIGAFGFSSGGTAVLEAALVDSRLAALVTLDATVRNYLGFWDTIGFKSLIAIGRLKRRLTGRDLLLKMPHLLDTAEMTCDPALNRRLRSDSRLRAAYSALPLPGAAPCSFVDTIRRVERITIPTRVIHGGHDRVDPPETGTMLHKRLTCVKDLHILPRSGHFGHLDHDRDRVMELTAGWMLEHLHECGKGGSA